MTYASIDIGSNAGRLLIGKVIEFNGKPMVEKVSLTRVPLRLGLDVFETAYISKQKQDLMIRTFDAYKKLIKIYEPQELVACGTAALREAKNKVEVIERVYNETGIDLKIITGIQEAQLTSLARNTNMNVLHDYSLYIDVGGGSTELSYYKGQELVDARSFQVGAIRFLLDTIKKSEWDAMKNWIAGIHTDEEPMDCFCSGGNINKLTKMFGSQLKNTLGYSQLADCLVHLEGYSVEDRMEEFGLRNDRADVIVPAAIIFKKLMKWGKIKEIQAPKIGLADGIIVDIYNKQNNLGSIL